MISPARYNPNELAGFLLEPSSAPAETAQLEWSFTMDPQAEPPADKFMLLTEIDQLFRASWRHARPELQDQSASAYDLALATRAMRANWTGQEIVNLLIAHRRKHKADLKLRKDYYERTLNAAATGQVLEERQAFIEELKKGSELPDAITKDPAESLAVLSGLLGVKITKLVRFRSTTNTYQLTVNGRVANIASVDMLESQTLFRRLILDQTDHLCEKLGRKAWDETVRRLFAAVQTVEAVAEATTEGALESWISLHVGGNVAREEEWQTAALKNNPFIKNGNLHIISEGLRRFVWNKCNEKLTTQYLAVQLTKLGYQSEKFCIRAKDKVATRRGWNLGLPEAWE